ncbi:alpha/beta hydrolase [bacterium]|nr:alpha/beta hydrolase [bacterium]MCI0616433.1 alpha/beta hydrolase [bacterium]
MNYNRFGEGPVIIYVAGLDGTGQLFSRQIEQLKPEFTIITFPLRNEAPFTYSDLTGDVVNILDQERVEKAIIIGESFGGTIALHFALEHQDRIERLVLVNTFPFFRRRLLLKLAKMLLPLAFVPLVRKGRDIFARPVLLSELVDEKGIEVLLKHSWTHTYETYVQRLKLIGSLDVRSRLSEITIPVTIVAAGRDKIIASIKEAKFMEGLIPNARIHTLPKHGHACLLSGSFSIASILGQEMKTE